MEKLTPRQRAHLKSLAHSLKPVIQVGREGVTEASIGSIEDALNTRELLKVKVLEAAPQSAREAAEAIEQLLPGGQVVQVIGRTIVVYRPSDQRPEIQLPY